MRLRLHKASCPGHARQRLVTSLGAGASDGVKGRISILVVFRVIGEILSCADVVEPLSVVLVPFDGLLKTGFQRYLRLPPEFVLDLVAVQGISPVMSGALLNVREQPLGLA